MTNETPKTRTITLSNRPPVTIREDQWPTIAIGDWNDSTNGIDQDASRRATIRVREHRDGRRIVYGVTKTRWQGERGRAAGVLVAAPAGLTPEQLATGDVALLGDTAATVAAIRDVADAIGYPDVAQDCIADLPAEAI